MASLGGLYFSVGLKDYTDKDWEKIEKKLQNKGLNVGLSVDKDRLRTEIMSALSDRKYTIDLSVAINDKQLEATIRNAYSNASKVGQIKPSNEAALIRANAYAESQKSLAKSRDALTKLREARLADAAATDTQVRANKRLSASLSIMPRMVEGLREQFLNLFSIYSVERFFSQLISIGGEFEKQHIALQSMLGDAAKANNIFSKIKGLAVESPFTFQNLASYTKQLTAFSIPYNELYDTTRRLADISAGIGVDMGRLILAYGQVRSAEFLRGQELRQFTEAGIPILDKLAQKFTELEGNIVSVGEVFDKISDREVPFEMVREILWDLTNEGGQFYKMQEVLTESLSGRLDKLKDSYQIMLSEISSSNSGILKGMIDMLTGIIDNWGAIITILKAVASAYMGYKAAILLVNSAQVINNVLAARRNALTNSNTIAMLREIATMKSRNVVLAKTNSLIKTFNKLKSVKGGWAGIIVGAVFALTAAISSVISKSRELKKELKGIDKETSGNILSLTASYKALVNDLGRATEGTKEYKDIISKINSGYGDYLDNLFSEAEAYDNVRNSIDAVSDAIIRKAQNQAYEQKIIAISNKYGEKFGQVQKDLAKVLDYGGEGINAEMSEQIAARIVALVRSYGYSLGDAVNIVSQEFGKDVESAIKKGSIVLGTNNFMLNRILQLESYVAEYEAAIKAVSNVDQSAPFQAGLDKISAMYDELIGQSKSLNEERDLEISKLQEQRRYIESIDFSGKGRILADIDRQIATYREGMAQWIEVSDEVAKNAVRQGEYEFTFSNLAPTEDEYRKSSEYFSRLVKDYEDTKKKLEELNATPLMGQDANFQKDKARYEARLRTISDIFKSNGTDIQKYLESYGNKTEVSEDPVAEQWRERLDLMKQAEKEFAKWQALLGTEGATAQLRGSGMFDALGDFNYADSRGEIESFVNEMANTAITDAQREIAQEGLEVVIDFRYDEHKNELDRALENIKNQMESTTKKWGLFKDILSKTNNRDLALGLTFGKDSTLDYPQMLKDIFNSQMTELGMPYTFDELFENGLDNVPDIVADMFNYTNESLNEFHEQERMRLIEMVAEYQTTADKIKAIETKLQNDLAVIRSAVENKRISPSTGMSMENAARSHANYEKFQLSSDYLGFYGAITTYTRREADEIGKAIKENLDDALQNGVISAKDYLREIKNIHKQLEKIRNPLQGSFFESGLQGMSEYQYQRGSDMVTRGQTQVDDAYESMPDYLDISDEINANAWDTAIAQQAGGEAMVQGGQGMMAGASAAMGAVSVVDTIVHGINDTVQGIADATRLMAEMADAYGADTGPGSGWGDAMQFMDTFAEASQYATDAWDSLKSGNIGGVIRGVVGSVTSWFTSFAKYHDAKIQREIDEIQDYIGQVSHLYDIIENRLQYALGSSSQMVVESAEKEVAQLERLQERKAEILSKGILNKTDLKQLEYVSNEIAQLQYRVNAYQTGGAYGYQRELLQEQLDMIQEQKRLEETKKNPDDDTLQEYENQIAELKDEIRYFAQDLANELYGIDIKGWAQQIGDALFDAWSKGESAADVYRDTVANIMGDLMNKVLTMSIIEPALKDLQTYLFGNDGKSGAFGSDFELDENEIGNIFGYFANLENVLGAWEEGMDAMYESGKEYGFDLKEILGGEDLTDGIKGITEDTANLLASYLNAIRQDVSIQRRLWEDFIGGMNFNQINVVAQAQLTQLQAIAVNTRNSADSTASILALLNSVSNGTKKFYMR